MAVIVYGTRKKIKVDKPLGVQQCPNCGHNVEMALAHEACHAHIYYIPLIPYPGWKVKLCPCCGVVQKYSKQEFKELKKS